MRRTVVILTLLLAAVVALVVAFWPTRPPPPPPPPAPRLAWTFEAPRPGFVVGAPAVTDDSVFLAVGHTRASRMSGAVYALDPATGKPKWVFDRDGGMLPTASTPLFDRDRLFVGEGMHNSGPCRLHCLDARGGTLKWAFATGDHIEGGPVVAGGQVIFPAGNDGLYALDAETGDLRWNFRADLHIDSTPFVAGGRVYAGSGTSRRFPALQVVCLDARTGNPVWRAPVTLPAWGSPVVAGDRVFVGLGNGRLTEPAQPPATPAGALACLDAHTGAERWTFPVADAVFGRPVVVGDRVVFGSRDGNLYGLDFGGREVFRIAMGGPVMAPPADDAGLVYAVAVPGRVACVNAADGREVWRYELSERGSAPEVYAGPRVAGGRLYVPGEMKSGPVSIVCLHCFDLP
jgi:serine/threonine-protein kinase